MEQFPSDEQILGFIREHRLEPVFDWAMRMVYPSVRVHFARFNVDQDDVADILQDAFIAFVEKTCSPGFQPENLAGLLYRICVNRQMKQHRDGGREIDLSKYSVVTGWKDYDPEVEAIKNMMKEYLYACLKKLPESQARIIMDYYSGFSQAEIASAIGSTENSVKALKYKAMVALKKCMKGWDTTPDDPITED